MKISVIVPVYNGAATILRALDSVAAQTVLPHEVIVSDDGSTDNTGDLVRQWSGEHSEITLQLIAGENGGVSVARNRAWRKASGDVVALLDADDEMLPRQLERLASGLCNVPDAVTAFGDVRSVVGSRVMEEALTTRGLVGWTEPSSLSGWLEVVDPFRANLSGNRIPNQCVLIRRSAMSACNGWDESIAVAEDRDFFLRLAGYGRFLFLPEVLAVKHECAGSLSTNRLRMRRYGFLVVVKAQACSAPGRVESSVLLNARDEYLYEASCAGLGALSLAIKDIQEAGLKVHPAGLLRSSARAVIQGLSRKLPLSRYVKVGPF